MQVQENRPTTAPGVPPTVATAPRSRLAGFVVSLTVLALGVLGVVDLAGAAVAGSAYLALPLAVTGLGLVAGAWFGRARWLIAIGAVLTVALGIASAAEGLATVDRDVTWRPTSIDQVESSYTINAGNALLDLSDVDFDGQRSSIRVRVSVGNLMIIVPSTVDVRVTAEVDVGNANLLGTVWSGIGQGGHTITDTGSDGPGGGELTIEATVDIGDLEVRR
jgi:hypothetical protein